MGFVPCWLVGVSIFHLKWQWKIPRWIRRTLWPSRLSWITRFGAPWRRCQTKLPARSASAPLREKVQRKSTTANSPNCNVHCSIHTARLLIYTVFSRSVYLTILHFQDFFFIDSASLVALEAAAGVGLSYLKLHLSIVNFCCAHLPLSIVDALDTTGRQFLRMSTRICRERFLPAPSQGYCECEHATHLKSGSAGPGAWWTAGKFLGKNRKSPGTRLWAAHFRLAIDYGNLESSNPFRCSFQRQWWPKIICDGKMLKKTMHLVIQI